MPDGEVLLGEGAGPSWAAGGMTPGSTGPAWGPIPQQAESRERSVRCTVCPSLPNALLEKSCRVRVGEWSGTLLPGQTMPGKPRQRERLRTGLRQATSWLARTVWR